MIVLVTGAAGFIGARLVATAPDDLTVVGTWRHTRPAPALVVHQVDLADGEATRRAVTAVRPDLVVHTAYTIRHLDRDVVAASRHVATAACAAGAGLIHLSSDVVFSGEDAPYDEDSPTAPMSAYGRAKAAAEEAVVAIHPDAAIVRTSLVLTPETLEPRTDWVVEAVRSGRPVDLYTDEVRMPVHRDDLTAGLWSLVRLPAADRAGNWHLTGQEPLTRYELGRLAVASRGLPVDSLRAVRSPRDGHDLRPRDLRLGCRRATAAIGWRPRSVTAAYARILSAQDAERR